MRATLIAGAAALLVVLASPGAEAVEQKHPSGPSWSFEGIFGSFDRAAQQRGLQVYQEVCSGCHSLKRVHYRNLGDLGYGDDEVKDIAAQYEVEACCTDVGETFTRPARPSDRFVSPFRNEAEARSFNNGALPPDLSLLTKSREGGADYVYSVLTGYEEPPEGVEMMDGMYYNPYFSGLQIAMPPPLFEDGIEYADATKASVERMARDVTVFLAWAAEPELEERKRLGIKVMLFVIVLTGLLYATKRKVWSDLH